MDALPIRRALLSVTDKSNLIEFASRLNFAGVEIVSTGGTMRLLQSEGLPVTAVSKVTGFPEMMDGRVKTLHPKIHAGILADKDNPEHLNALAVNGILPFDLVCVNLYDFSSAIKKSGITLKEAVEYIDVGGPTMLRAAAKNFHSVLVIPSPDFYEPVLKELSLTDKDSDITRERTVSLSLRLKTAAATFALLSAYDSAIADFLTKNESKV